MQAKAMVLRGFKQPLVLETVELTPREDEIIVEIVAAGVCGSDLHMWQGQDPRVQPPVILGHEGVGRIAVLPQAKQDIVGNPLAVGDLVIWNRALSCGQCYYCQVLYEPALCPARWTYGINPPQDPAQVPTLRGCFASHIRLDRRVDFLRLPPQTDPAAVIAASCSGATAAHAMDLAQVRPGDVVVIQGTGPLGLFAIALAKTRGARVIVIGSGEKRLAHAAALGAEQVWDYRATSAEARREAVLAATDGRGADLVVEGTGHPSALPEGIELVRTGGTYLLAGFGNPAGRVELDCFTLSRKNLRLQGVWVSDTRHLVHAVAQVQAEPRLADMNTAFPFAQANEAMAAMAQRKVIKAILTF